MEPGCYFIKALLFPAMEYATTSKFFNRETIERFRNFGGVRIESDLVMSKIYPLQRLKVKTPLKSNVRYNNLIFVVVSV